jgi:uncharacterized protein
MVTAQAVYVLFGFGAGMIAVGGMALFLPNATDVVVVLLLVSLPPELFVVSRSYREVSARGVGLIGAGIAVGVLAGTHLLVVTEPRLVLAILGGSLVLAGLALSRLSPAARVRWPAWAGLPVGLGSGVLGGMFGAGGPPLILYYRLSGASKAAFRGNLMAIFLLITLIRLPAYAVAGLLTGPRLASAAALLPAALAGALVGHRVHLEVSESRFRLLVSAALCLIGALLLLR